MYIKIDPKNLTLDQSRLLDRLASDNAFRCEPYGWLPFVRRTCKFEEAREFEEILGGIVSVSSNFENRAWYMSPDIGDMVGFCKALIKKLQDAKSYKRIPYLNLAIEASLLAIRENRKWTDHENREHKQA